MRYSRFTFVENTISNSPNVQRANFLGNDRLLVYATTDSWYRLLVLAIYKFGSFKNTFATITSLSERYRFRRFILLVKTEKWFLWTMAAAQAAENHGDEWGLTLYLRWGIYTSIRTWIHSQKSQVAAKALSLKMPSHGTSLKWSQRPSQSARE